MNWLAFSLIKSVDSNAAIKPNHVSWQKPQTIWVLELFDFWWEIYNSKQILKFGV